MGDPHQGDLALNDQTILAIERNYLAMERNLLAWVRTSITLVTFGFAIHHYFRANVPVSESAFGPMEFGFYMTVLGILGLFLAIMQYRRDRGVLQRRYAGYRLPGSFLEPLCWVFGLLSGAGLVATLV